MRVYPPPGMGNADGVKSHDQRHREGRNQAQGHTVITWN
jgi:hypothetical protein